MSPARMAAARLDRHEYLVAYLVGCVLMGAYGLLVDDPARSTAQELHPAVLIVWYFGLIAGGVLSLVGLTTHDPLGLAVHTGGLAVLVVPTLAYCAAAATVDGSAGVAILMGLFALANVRRAVRTGRALRSYRRAVRAAARRQEAARRVVAA